MLDGLRFYDAASGRWMLCKVLGGELWLCFLHPDGQWVTQRKATEDDVRRLTEAQHRGEAGVTE
jgi:hypothetical protein